MANGTDAVLRYWHIVETLTAGAVPKPANHASYRVADLHRDGPLPWDPAQSSLDPPAEGREWQFTVFGGLFELGTVHQALIEHFGDDRAEKPRPSKDLSALFVFSLDGKGDVVPGSAAVSRCAWAVSSLLGRSRANLDGWEDEQRSFVAEIDRLADQNRPSPTGAERPPEPDLRERAARRFSEAGRAAFGEGAKASGALAGAVVGAASGPAGTIIGPVVAAFVEKLLAPREKSDGEDDRPRDQLDVPALTGLVEGLVDVLGTDALSPTGIRVEARQIVPGEATSTFLNGYLAPDIATVLSAERRGNVGEALSTYLRLPTDAGTGRRLDLAEAPEHAVADVQPRHSPTARWPAPPEHALVQSQQLAVNHAARLGSGSGVLAVNGPPGTGKTTLLRDLIASVVTDRACRLAMLDRPDDAFDRRRHVATFENGVRMPFLGPTEDLAGFEMVLGTTTKTAAANVTAEIPAAGSVDLSDDPEFEHFTALASAVLDEPAWGLIAAQLGARRKRDDFARVFWSGRAGMMRLLKDAEEHPPPISEWRTAVDAFRAARAEVARLVTERQPAAKALDDLPELLRRAASSDVSLAELDGRHRRGVAAERSASARHDEAEAAVESGRHRLADLTGHGLFVFFRRGPAAWSDRQRQRATADRRLRALEGELLDLRATRAASRSELVEVERRLEEVRDERQRLQCRIDAAEASLADARRRWRDHIPDPSAGLEGQRCAAWADPEMSRARTRVFLAALRLHRAFVLGAAHTVRRSTSVAVDLIKGAHVAADDDARLAAWRTFFLLVPVVSTTFASLATLFRGVGREGLGWLLVDEAGQSTPQSLVGGLWRCRRAVVVGDPRQLEPVMPLPPAVRAALGRHARVSAAWSDIASAQEIADRVTPTGTYLRGAGDTSPLWVGLPLRVHRRCDRPVFETFSRMAYGPGLLVYGTPARSPLTPGSAWRHVPMRAGSGKWSDAEGRAVEELLEELACEEGALRSTLILTPFRDIESELRRLSDRVRRVGTVHTAQGQEADTVVLVLGTGRPDRRAREWLTERPNLLNVAVSRARRRIFVVGDRDVWSRYPYADELAAGLGAPRPSARVEGLEPPTGRFGDDSSGL